MTSSTECAAIVPASAPGLYAWEIIRYQTARWALSSTCFSKDPLLAWEATYGHAVPSEDHQANFVHNLANSDPPAHTRLRRILTKAFTPARVKGMRPRIIWAARALMDRMAPSGNVDLIKSFIFPLQVVVTCELLGIPSQHQDNYRCLAAEMRAAGDSDGLSGKYQNAYYQMGTVIADVLAAKREQVRITDVPNLQPDLLSALVVARRNSDCLSTHELQAMTMLLISAGQDPTIDMIANGLLALSLDPTQRQLFCRSPELLPQATEEILRCGVPVLSAPRIAAEDINVDGTVVRRGSLVAVLLDRAHRDPFQFSQPNIFDITRKSNAHLAFGHGIHYCIGAPLARLQAGVALGVLMDRFPNIALAQAPDRLRWRHVDGTRGLVELPVTLGPACHGTNGVRRERADAISQS